MASVIGEGKLSRRRPFGGLVRAAAFVCGVAFAGAQAQTISYRLEASKPLSRFTANQIALLTKLNHADSAHLAHLPFIVIPGRWDADELVYSPMPQALPQLFQETKAIVVDLAAQAFGAYESGRLIRWGPVSSGDHRHRPLGTYHLNWHARVHVSTENRTWLMPLVFQFCEWPRARAASICVARLPREQTKWLRPGHWCCSWAATISPRRSHGSNRNGGPIATDRHPKVRFHPNNPARRAGSCYRCGIIGSPVSKTPSITGVR
jgi:hypothetical protein